MKRLCTEEEKMYLKKNYKQLLEGVAKKSAHFKVGDIFLVLLVFGVVMISIAHLFAKVLSDFVFFLLTIILSFFINSIVHAFLITVRTNRVKRRFFRHQRFFLNGATVVKVHENLLTLDFTYIEDDEFLYDSTPYGIKFHSLHCDIGELSTGDRLLLIYADNGIDNPKYRTFQIMKMPSEWSNHIIADTPLSDQYETLAKHLVTYPHPNGITIQKEPRLLTTQESQQIGETLDKEASRSLRIVMFCLMASIFIIDALCLIINLKNGHTFMDILSNGIGLFLLIPTLVIFVVIPVTWIIILKKTRQNPKGPTHVQEVLFKDYLVESRGQTSTVFYEWDGTKYKETEHKNSGIKAAYGDVITKYIYESGPAIYKKQKH